MRHGVKSELIILTSALAACWPVWGWYVERSLDRSDEPWGLVALATFAVTVWQARQSTSIPGKTRSLLGPAFALMLYAVSYPFLPMLIRAMLALAALGLLTPRLLGPKALPPASWGLLFLSLPMLASLEFYGGYPLRRLTALFAAALIRLSGHAVSASGTALSWGEQTISVDAPCSGVRMLWVGLYLALSLSSFLRLGRRKTGVMLVVSVAALIIANVERAAALFFVESGIFELPAVAHEMTGLIVFVAAALFTARLAVRSFGGEQCANS